LVALVSQHVKLRRRGRAYVGLCPFHDEKTPSFKVENGHYICFGCGAKGDAIEWLRTVAGLPFRDAVAALANTSILKAPLIATQKALAVKIGTDDKERTTRALEIWNESVCIGGTIAEKYLVRRIGGPIPRCAGLRFHRACPRGDQRVPALVSLLRDVVTDEPLAIQRVFLRDDGSDRLRDSTGKMTLGPARNAVVKLTPDEDVTTGLAITEGVEKGLAIMAAGWSPIWATCGTSTMTTFPVLDRIEAMTVFADKDAAGQKAAVTCAERWAASGREVEIRTPITPGRDWDDALKGTE
jgi:DNA primase